MKRTIVFLTTVVLILTACSDKQSKQREALGADVLLAEINIAFENKKYFTVKVLYEFIESHYRETPEYKEAENIYYKVIDIQTEEAYRNAEVERQAKLEALKKLKLKKTVDDVSGITWYQQPYFTHYNSDNLTSIYMGDNGARHWLRLKMSYEGNDWIFFERAYLSYDGNTKEIFFDEYKDKKTEVGHGGSVWEWIDLTVTKDVEVFLRQFAYSQNAKMRLSGKYAKTRTLTDNERKGILDVLNGYDVFSGSLPDNS